MRSCPRCHVPLEAAVVANLLPARMVALAGATVTADVCADCGGVFLDRGELGLLTGALGIDASLRATDLPSDGVACPGCTTPMTAESVPGLVLDACGACGGFWFDKGELSRLRRAVASIGRE